MTSIQEAVSSLGNEDTDIVEWVVQALAKSSSTGNSQDATDNDVAPVQKSLQTFLFESNRTLATSMQRVLQSVPSLENELQHILTEGGILRECLLEINSRVETTYDDEPLDDEYNYLSSSVDPLQKLLELETTLSNMQSTTEKLSHHALWSKSMRDARQRMYSDEILPAASLLLQLQKTLVVLEDLPGNEERAASLETLSREFDESLRPGLKKALKADDVVRLRMYLDIFRNMDDVAGFESLYVSARCSILSLTWEEKRNERRRRKRSGGGGRTVVEEEEDDGEKEGMLQWEEIAELVTDCLADTRAMIKRERDTHLPALFQQQQEITTTSVRMMKKLLRSSYLAMPISSSRSNSSVLPTLEELLQVHRVVEQSMKEIYEESEVKEEQEWQDVLRTMFQEYESKYIEMEVSTMELELMSLYPILHSLPSSPCPRMEDVYDELHDKADILFQRLHVGMERCFSFLKNNGCLLYVQAATTITVQFYRRIQDTLQRLSNLPSAPSSAPSSASSSALPSDDNDNVSTSLRIVLALREHERRLSTSYARELRAWSQRVGGHQQDDVDFGVACSEASATVRVAVRCAYDVTMVPILGALKPVPGMEEIWSNVVDDVNDYEIYGQLEYATFIGEYWIDLVQKLEPLEEMLLSGRSVVESERLSEGGSVGSGSRSGSGEERVSFLNDIEAMEVLEQEWDRSAIELKLERSQYMGGALSDGSWVALVVHGTIARYCTMVASSMLHLSEYGACQLSEDVTYLLSVTSAMGVTTSPLLSHVRDLLAMDRDALQVLSDQSDRENRPSHASQSSSSSSSSSTTMPRGLLLNVCKMRGILTTF